jgi:hypothetical protein
MNKAVPARCAARKVTTQREEGAGSAASHGLGTGWQPQGRPQLTVLVYRRDMPGRKRPTAEDTRTARRVLLDGLARDTDIFELLERRAALHPRRRRPGGLDRCARRAGIRESTLAAWRHSAESILQGYIQAGCYQ